MGERKNPWGRKEDFLSSLWMTRNRSEGISFGKTCGEIMVPGTSYSQLRLALFSNIMDLFLLPLKSIVKMLFTTCFH